MARKAPGSAAIYGDVSPDYTCLSPQMGSRIVFVIEIGLIRDPEGALKELRQ